MYTGVLSIFWLFPYTATEPRRITHLRDTYPVETRFSRHERPRGSTHDALRPPGPPAIDRAHTDNLP